MENEIMEMVNEEVVTDVTEVVPTESGKGWKVAAGVGLTILAGVVAFKIGKKIVAKIKAKKEEAGMIENVEYTEVDQTKVDSEEEAE